MRTLAWMTVVMICCVSGSYAQSALSVDIQGQLDTMRNRLTALAVPTAVSDIPAYRDQIIQQAADNYKTLLEVNAELQAKNWSLQQQGTSSSTSPIPSNDPYINELRLTREECRKERQECTTARFDEYKTFQKAREEDAKRLQDLLTRKTSKAGCTMGRFDEEIYLSENKDVAEAVKRGEFTSGRQHYDIHGYKEARPGAPCKKIGERIGDGGCATGGFDEKLYLAQNKDVAEAVKRGEFTSGRQHYDIHGFKENRAGAPCKKIDDGGLVAPGQPATHPGD